MEGIHPRYRFLALGILLLSLGCMPGEVSGQQEEARTLIANQFEKWRSGEARFFDLLDDNLVWEVSGRSSVSGAYNGKEEFLNLAVAPITNQLATQIIPELISITADEKFVWLRWQGKATAENGSSYDNEYLWKMVVEHAKITQVVAVLDTHEQNLLMTNKENTMQIMEETKAYIGMWVTKDGYIRHELLPDFRYDEARGSKESAYQGSYTISGNHIDYKDDTGFTADGEFKDGILYHAGMILYKEE